VHNEPSLFDDELSADLRRVEAPQGFVESVFRRLGTRIAQTEGASDPGSSSSFRHVSRLRALSFSSALAAALLLMLLPLGGYLYQRHRQAQAQAAAQQFTLAMRLTHAALLDAGQQVAEHDHARNPQNQTREESNP
jgi:hypothetical protein